MSTPASDELQYELLRRAHFSVTDEERSQLYWRWLVDQGEEPAFKPMFSNRPLSPAAELYYEQHAHLRKEQKVRAYLAFAKEMVARGLWQPVDSASQPSQLPPPDKLDWLSHASISSSSALLGAALFLSESGSDELRASVVNTLLEERVGRTLSNQSMLIRQLAQMDPPLVEILSESSVGRGGTVFRLLPAGLTKARSLRDAATTRPKL